jgi:hypothetical protein
MSIPTSRARLLIIVVPFQFSAEPVRASERCKRTEVSGTLVSSASPQPTSLVAGASPQRLVIPPVDPQPQLRPPHTVDERHTTDPIPARHGHDIDALETFDRRRPDGRHTGASDECESTSSTTSTSGFAPEYRLQPVGGSRPIRTLARRTPRPARKTFVAEDETRLTPRCSDVLSRQPGLTGSPAGSIPPGRWPQPAASKRCRVRIPA